MSSNEQITPQAVAVTVYICIKMVRRVFLQLLILYRICVYFRILAEHVYSDGEGNASTLTCCYYLLHIIYPYNNKFRLTNLFQTLYLQMNFWSISCMNLWTDLCCFACICSHTYARINEYQHINECVIIYIYIYIHTYLNICYIGMFYYLYIYVFWGVFITFRLNCFSVDVLCM